MDGNGTCTSIGTRTMAPILTRSSRYRRRNFRIGRRSLVDRLSRQFNRGIIQRRNIVLHTVAAITPRRSHCRAYLPVTAMLVRRKNKWHRLRWWAVPVGMINDRANERTLQRNMSMRNWVMNLLSPVYYFDNTSISSDISRNSLFFIGTEFFRFFCLRGERKSLFLSLFCSNWWTSVEKCTLPIGAELYDPEQIIALLGPLRRPRRPRFCILEIETKLLVLFKQFSFANRR